MGNWEIEVRFKLNPTYVATNNEAASAYIDWPDGLNGGDEALSYSIKAIATGWFDKLLRITKVRQPGHFARVLGFGKVALVRCYQHQEAGRLIKVQSSASAGFQNFNAV